VLTIKLILILNIMKEEDTITFAMMHLKISVDVFALGGSARYELLHIFCFYHIKVSLIVDIANR
jgi:hypothetical protein